MIAMAGCSVTYHSSSQSKQLLIQWENLLSQNQHWMSYASCQSLSLQTLTLSRSQAVNLTKIRIHCPDEPKLVSEIKALTLSTECTIHCLVLLDGFDYRPGVAAQQQLLAVWSCGFPPQFCYNRCGHVGNIRIKIWKASHRFHPQFHIYFWFMSEDLALHY